MKLFRLAQRTVCRLSPAIRLGHRGADGVGGGASESRLAPALLAAALLLGAAPAFETEAPVRASRVLPAELFKGPHHTVAEEVKAEGFYQRFQIASDYGELEAQGRTMLRTRVTEVDALSRLSEVSKSEVFAKAAGGAVLNVGKGVAAVVKDPGATAKGIGGGVKRVGVNLGRKGKRTAESVTQDDKKPDQAADASAQDKALSASGNAAKSVLGVNAAARRWAQKLGVDPYTTNQPLHQALVDIGKIDTAGGIAAKVVVPVPMVVSTTAKVGGLVWSADPEALRKQNEAGLAAVRTPKDVVSRFFANGNYTLTSQTRFIGALAAVKADGCDDYVDAAGQADDEREALFFVESAELLAGLHKVEPVSAVLKDSRAMIARTGTKAVALLPFDSLVWTEPLQKAALELAARARKELGVTTLEIRISGTATPAAKAGLLAAGWVVKEQFVSGLIVAPAD